MMETRENKCDQFEEVVPLESDLEENDCSARWIPVALKHIMRYREDEIPGS